MAFVSRRKEDKPQPKKDKTTQADKKLSESLAFIENQKVELEEKARREFFTEQAKQVLDLLESRGIDLYDENNKPGMYLKKRGQTNKKNNLVQQLVYRSKQDESSETDNKSDLIKQLLAKSKK